MVNSIKLSNSYLTQVDSWNDQGVIKRLGAKGCLVASIAPSTFAALAHTFAALLQTTILLPLKFSAKILFFGPNVEIMKTLNSIRSNSSLAVRFAVAAFAIPLFAMIRNSYAIKIGEKLGLTDVCSIKKIRLAKETAKTLRINKHQAKIQELKNNLQINQTELDTLIPKLPGLEAQIKQIRTESQNQITELPQEDLPIIEGRLTRFKDYLTGTTKIEKMGPSRAYKIKEIQKATRKKIAPLQREIHSIKQLQQKQVRETKKIEFLSQNQEINSTVQNDLVSKKVKNGKLNTETTEKTIEQMIHYFPEINDANWDIITPSFTKETLLKRTQRTLDKLTIVHDKAIADYNLANNEYTLIVSQSSSKFKRFINKNLITKAKEKVEALAIKLVELKAERLDLRERLSVLQK